MAFQEEVYPEGTQLLKPDQSIYVFVKVLEDFDPGTYVELNVNGHVTKFKGGLRFPPAIIVETVPKNWYSFVMIRPPQAPQQSANPSGGIIKP